MRTHKNQSYLLTLLIAGSLLCGCTFGTKTAASMTREEFMEEYNVYHLAKENYADPEELADEWMRELTEINNGTSDRISPWEGIHIMDKEDWEKKMTEKYGDAWKEW